MSRQQHASPRLRRLARRAVALAPLAAALALPASGHAQQSPYSIGVSQAFSRDGNIFRAAKGTPDGGIDARGRRMASDTISTTSLLAGVDQPIGRQRLRADASVRYNKFQDESQLDNTSYRLGLGADWETVGRLSGTLGLIAQQSLAPYGAESAFATSSRVLERARQFDARVQYGGPAVLTVYGLFGHRSVDYSSPSTTTDLLDFDRDQIGAGLRYRVSGALTLGAEARTAKGEYPNQPDEFDRHDLSLTALWLPSGASRVNARLSATQQKYDIAVRDFSGVTGALTWSWQPTGKTRIETELLRETGQELDLLRTTDPSTQAIADTSEVANRLQVRAVYDATAKIQLDALARYTRRSLFDPTLLVPSGDDDTAFVSVGLRYLPTRTITLGCSVGHENRDANATSQLTYPYRVNTASCFAQLLLNP